MNDKSDLYAQPKDWQGRAEKWWEQIEFVMQYTRDTIIKDIERWHLAGCMVGNKCDRGHCDCEAMIDLVRSNDSD